MIREAKAAEAAHPHRLEVTLANPGGRGYWLKCACGFSGTYGSKARGIAIWKRHRAAATIREKENER